MSQCKNCRWWIGNAQDGFAQCHRRAPVNVSQYESTSAGYVAVWPATWRDSGCGDFEARPIATTETAP